MPASSKLQSIPVLPGSDRAGERSGERLLCHCMRVTEGEIHEGIAALESPTVEDVACLTGAGTGCTACRCRIDKLIQGKSACGAFGLCDGCGCCHAICGCTPAQAERCPSAHPCREE